MGTKKLGKGRVKMYHLNLSNVNKKMSIQNNMSNLKTSIFSRNLTSDFQKEHNVPDQCVNLLAKKGSVLFLQPCSVPAVRKAKQTWSVESFSAFARLKELTST